MTLPSIQLEPTAMIMAHQPVAGPPPSIPTRRGPGRRVGEKGEAIVSAFAKRNGLSLEEIKSKRAAFRIARIRWGAMYELYATGDYSYPTIGAYFGLDQSSIRHGVHSWVEWLKAEAEKAAA